MNDFEVICRKLIEAGRKIFPLRAGSKVPRRKKWYECATQSQDEMLAVMLNAQLQDGKPSGIGCCVGAVSEVLTIDVDYKHPEALDWEEKHRALLEEGLVVRSGGGRHYHFHHPYGADYPIVSEIGKIERGVDLLCDMNPGVNPRYVVIPPSIHPNGTPYKYEDDFGATLADKLPYLSNPLLKLIENRDAWANPEPEAKPSQGGKSDPNFYVDNPHMLFAVDPFCEEPIEEGNRNCELSRMAGKLLTIHVDDPDYCLTSLVTDMTEINEKRCTPPVSDEEVRALCNSISSTRTKAEAKKKEKIKEVGVDEDFNFTEPSPVVNTDPALATTPALPPKFTMPDAGEGVAGGRLAGNAFNASSPTMAPPEQRPANAKDDPNMAAIWILHQPPFAPTSPGGDYSVVRMETSFYLYDDNVWVSVSDQYIESVLQGYYPSALKAVLGNMMSFLKNHLYYPIKSLPFWKTGTSSPGYPSDPRKVIAFNNGLFDVEHYISTGDAASSLKPHTENMFNTVKLRYDYDPEATCPVWESFVNSIWPIKGDERPEALRQWAGYLMVPDISQHKIAILCGVPRSGKSTIGRTMFKLIGPENSASTNLHSIATEHGVSPLIGKNLAIMFDAHMPSKSGSDRAIEMIKGISGADPQVINPKFQHPYTMTLTTRLMLVCNEIPRLRDGGNALLARMIPFACKINFTGREDHELPSKIDKEMPGIANWAIKGLKTYIDAGRLAMPKESIDELVFIKRVLNPVSAFADDCLTYPAADSDYVALDDLHRAWNTWTDVNYISHAGSKDSFFSMLRAICPPNSQGRVGGNIVWRGMKMRDDITVVQDF